jgi:hypothetical protein
VWVLEVNESPDLSHSTSTTAALVPQLLRDMTRVVIDAERLVRDGDGAGAKSWSKKAREKLDTGRFEMLFPARRHNECISQDNAQPAQVLASLQVSGAAMTVKLK